jgi:hypothetical protein
MDGECRERDDHGCGRERQPVEDGHPPVAGAELRPDQDQNLRFAATQTVSRPEYRELSPIAYFEQVGFAVTQGNPSLDRALIQNIDLRGSGSLAAARSSAPASSTSTSIRRSRRSTSSRPAPTS